MRNCLSRKSPRQTFHLHLFIFFPLFYTSLASSNASCLFFFFFNLIHTKLKVSWYWWMKFGTSKTYPKGTKLWWWTSGRATSGYCSEADESRLSQVSLNAHYTAWLCSFEYSHILDCLDWNPDTLSSSYGSILGHNLSGFSVRLSMAEKVIIPIL